MFHHLWGKVETEYGCTRIAQIAGNVTRATAHVTYFAASFNISRQTAEQLPIKRFLLKFVEYPAGILIREPIVTYANGLYEFVVHTDCQVTRVGIVLIVP